MKSRASLNGSKKSVALLASIGWRSDYGLCAPRNSSGNFAIFAAIRRASSLVSSLAADRLARLALIEINASVV